MLFFSCFFVLFIISIHFNKFYSFYFPVSGEMLMFGGEYCDGEGTTVFNDLLRWNVEKGGGEWYVSMYVLECVCAVQPVYVVFFFIFFVL